MPDVNLIRAYNRVSHIESAKSGLSPEAQREMCLAWWNSVKHLPDFEDSEWSNVDGHMQEVVYEPARNNRGRSRGGKVQWGKQVRKTTDGFFVDEGTSAFKTMFEERPAANALLSVLQPGDTLILPYLDRGFRNAADALHWAQRWREQGIRLVVLNPMLLDSGTPQGKLMFGLFAVFAEFDSNMKSERNREIIASMKRNGRIHNRCPGVGWKRGSDNKQSKFHKMRVPDNDERRLVLQMVRMVEQQKAAQQKVNYQTVSDVIEQQLADRDGRPPNPDRAVWDHQVRRRYNRDRIRLIYLMWTNGRIPPPTDEPPPLEYKEVLRKLQAKKNKRWQNQPNSAGDQSSERPNPHEPPCLLETQT